MAIFFLPTFLRKVWQRVEAPLSVLDWQRRLTLSVERLTWRKRMERLFGMLVEKKMKMKKPIVVTSIDVVIPLILEMHSDAY